MKNMKSSSIAIWLDQQYLTMKISAIFIMLDSKFATVSNYYLKGYNTDSEHHVNDVIFSALFEQRLSETVTEKC